MSLRGMLPGMVPASESRRTQSVGIFKTPALCCPFRQTQSPTARVSSCIFPPILNFSLSASGSWYHADKLTLIPFLPWTPRASRLPGQDLHMEQLWACKHVNISTIFFLGTFVEPSFSYFPSAKPESTHCPHCPGQWSFFSDFIALCTQSPFLQ